MSTDDPDSSKDRSQAVDTALIGGGLWWMKTHPRSHIPIFNRGDAMHLRSRSDWCAFRRDSRCFYPHTLDAEATAKTNGKSIVWQAIDRGNCPRIKWAEQEACPIGEPGANSGAPNANIDMNIEGQTYHQTTA
jgi:hypothetical protein